MVTIGDRYFGDACTVVAAAEYYGTWVSPDETLKIVAVPDLPEVTDDLVLALSERDPFDGMDLLPF